jgi:hypothetical protein
MEPSYDSERAFSALSEQHVREIRVNIEALRDRLRHAVARFFILIARTVFKESIYCTAYQQVGQGLLCSAGGRHPLAHSASYRNKGRPKTGSPARGDIKRLPEVKSAQPHGGRDRVVGWFFGALDSSGTSWVNRLATQRIAEHGAFQNRNSD